MIPVIDPFLIFKEQFDTAAKSTKIFSIDFQFLKYSVLDHEILFI